MARRRAVALSSRRGSAVPRSNRWFSSDADELCRRWIGFAPERDHLRWRRPMRWCTEILPDCPSRKSALLLTLAGADSEVPKPVDSSTALGYAAATLLHSADEEVTKMGKGKRVAIYVRVSTDGQSVENQ